MNAETPCQTYEAMSSVIVTLLGMNSMPDVEALENLYAAALLEAQAGAAYIRMFTEAGRADMRRLYAGETVVYVSVGAAKGAVEAALEDGVSFDGYDFQRFSYGWPTRQSGLPFVRHFKPHAARVQVKLRLHLLDGAG